MNRQDVEVLIEYDINPHCPSVTLENGEIVYQHKYYPYKFDKDNFVSEEGLGLFSCFKRNDFTSFLEKHLSYKDILVLCQTSKAMNIRCSNEK